MQLPRLTLIGITVLLLATTAGATDYTFTAATGFWDHDANWAPPGVPSNGDSASIPVGKTCYIDGDQECSGLVVAGTLEVQGGHSLTMSTNYSEVTGDLKLAGTEENQATLYVNGLTIGGAGGEIEMWHGRIDSLGDGPGLTLGNSGNPYAVHLHGDGEINVWVANNAKVTADHDGETLRFTSKCDGSTNGYIPECWRANSGGRLQFDGEVSGEGGFLIKDGDDDSRIIINDRCWVRGAVWILRGSFIVGEGGSFCTNGSLNWNLGNDYDTRIEVKAGGYAAFGASCFD